MGDGKGRKIAVTWGPSCFALLSQLFGPSGYYLNTSTESCKNTWPQDFTLLSSVFADTRTLATPVLSCGHVIAAAGLHIP